MKRIISITIAAIILLAPAVVLAEAKYSLTYERAVALMNVNNGDLKKLERAENDARRNFESNVLQAQNIDTEGFTVSFGGKDYYINYDIETKIAMRKIKELVPEQMKFSWEAARDNRTTTINSLKKSLRDIFFMVYNASEDVKLKQKQLDLAAMINQQDKLKLENGMITNLDMQESEYNLLKAQNNLNDSRRNYENMVRSFNQFVGLPAKTQYTEIIFEGKLSRPEWKPVDYYIEQALNNRSDIVNIHKLIALKEQEKSIIESYNVYRISTTAQNEYESLLNDIEQLNINLEIMKITITDEIMNAYADVMKAGKSVDSINNTLKLQQSTFNKLQSKYKAGLTSKNMLMQAEIGLEQVKNSYNAVIFDYNTRIIRFQNASGIGPEY